AHGLAAFDVLVDAPTRQARLVQGPTRQPLFRPETRPTAVALVRPGVVRHDAFLHPALEELHVNGLPLQPIPSLDLAAATSRAGFALDHDPLVRGERQTGRLGALVDLLESLVGADVDPLALIVEVGAVAGALEVAEDEVRPAVHGPFRGGLRE